MILKENANLSTAEDVVTVRNAITKHIQETRDFLHNLKEASLKASGLPALTPVAAHALAPAPAPAPMMMTHQDDSAALHEAQVPPPAERVIVVREASAWDGVPSAHL
mmetsp:Transcript_75583/g.173004  ORF Transcript_75583/g.173004 Transcript_75583/m.173004 type:complete len:107 (+) Transcript_75583:339-659(+)